MKNEEKRLRPLGHRSVELHFGLCLQQKRLWGVGVWLKDAGRRLQKSPKSRGIAVIARDSCPNSAKPAGSGAPVIGKPEYRLPHNADEADSPTSPGVECGIPGVELCKPFRILIE
ncbi:MAG TPA: hypothetical protein VL793_08530, partial [Patescibacteria group bacterium]|nr:hypothetical protein [Patescibacteria group bacterium]